MTINFFEILINISVFKFVFIYLIIFVSTSKLFKLKYIKTYNSKHDKGDFPNYEIKRAIYTTLDQRLDDLKDSNPILYQDLIHKTDLNERIDKFLNLESEFWAGTPKSNNYNEVEMAANQEQEIWSDKAASPPLSPQFIQETVMETIEKDKPKSPLEDFWNRLKNRNKDEGIIGPELLPEAR